MEVTVTRPGVSSISLYVKVISETQSLDNSRPVTFILPGGPGGDHRLYLQYECLYPVTNLVFHDPRGCGQSLSTDFSDCTMVNYIEDVESIRQALAIEKIILIGKSYGSMCALGYALQYPQHVKKLVLAAGAPSYRFIEQAKQNVKKIGTDEQIKWCEKLWTGSFKNREELLRYFEVTQPLYSINPKKTQTVDLIKKSHQFSYQVLNLGFRHSFWLFDYEALLANITVPTLVLAGEEDWINDSQYARFMAERIPRSFLKIFSSSSHAMEVDVGEEYFQLIADFIDNPRLG